jgi:glucose/arabinose dehydrogenase
MPTGPHFVEPLESRQLFTVIAGFAESVVASGLTRPTQLAFAPDGRLFITQQDGKLRVVKNGQLLSTPFVTVNTQNTGERGLIGVAFDPNFASNKFVYVYYTHPESTGVVRNRVSRFTASGDTAALGSEKVLIETDALGTGTWHNSGGMHFGADGKLYVGIGENQQGAPAQSLTSLLGKVIRINPDGTIPSDNPFYNQTTGKYRAIWARGFRNPFTMDVQPGTGRIFVNDVGAAAWEEINELKKGANYGWPNAEGPSTNTAYTNAFYTYPHAGGDFDDSAITGAAFYNPQTISFPSDYVGDFFFGDYGLDAVKRIDLNTKQVNSFVSNVDEVTDVEVGPDGAVYYTSRSGGRVYKAQATTSNRPTIVIGPESQTVAVGQPVTFSVTAGGTNLGYQWQRNGANIAGATGPNFTIPSASLSDHNDKFRVIVSNSAGSATSAEATLTVLAGNAPTATINGPIPPWVGGGQLSFSGTGTDPEDGVLPASAFTWEIVTHHDTHTHPFIAPYSGVKSDTIPISDIGETEPNIWYRIHLTVKDSTGLTSSTFVDVLPQKVSLALATEPAGLSLNLDGAPVATPFGSPAVVGLLRQLSAPPVQVLDGVTYAFDGWNDGGAIAHGVHVPAADVTYTARYKVSTATTHSLGAADDAFVRDGTYASTNFGASADLQVKTDGVGWTRQSYLSFPLGNVGLDVTSARLRLTARLDNSTTPSVPVSIYAASGGWGEGTITWNNKPASGATVLGSFTVSGLTAKTYEVDLTSFLQQQKAAGATSVTLVLKSGATKSTVIIASEEAAANKPELVVTSGGDPGGGGDPGPAPGPTLLRATADTYARSGSYGATNFGSAGELQVKLSSAVDYTRETYLKLDLSTLATITSAKLRLNGRLTESGSVQTAVYKADDTTWSESGLTWNARPPAGTTAAATTTVSGTANQWYEWDVTALLQAEKAAGRTAVTLVLKNLAQTSATLVFASDEASANRPELVVS